MQSGEGAVLCHRCEAPDSSGHICADLLQQQLAIKPASQMELAPVQQRHANAHVENIVPYGYPIGYPQAQLPYWESYFRTQALMYQEAYNNINIIPPPPPPPAEPILSAMTLVPPHVGSTHYNALPVPSPSAAGRLAKAARARWISHSASIVRAPPPAVPSHHSKRTAIPTSVITYKSSVAAVPSVVHSLSFKKAAKKPPSKSSSRKSSISQYESLIYSYPKVIQPECIYILTKYKYIRSVPSLPLPSNVSYYRYIALPHPAPIPCANSSKADTTVQPNVGIKNIHEHLNAMVAATRGRNPIYIPPYHEFQLHSLADCGYCWYLLRALLREQGNATWAPEQEEPLNLVIRSGPRE